MSSVVQTIKRLEQCRYWFGNPYVEPGEFRNLPKSRNTKAFDRIITKANCSLFPLARTNKSSGLYRWEIKLLNNEPVIFESEILTSIYERTYNHKIDIRISNENALSRDYTYVTSQQNSLIRINGLDEGIYRIILACTATIDNKKETAAGSLS
ncbi:MAG: hypothetical protein U5K79_03450 [Cyclobacteriaceae bacterium]|nr:hypothetical protein [Cyclobacteriaceae bacterium]